MNLPINYVHVAKCVLNSCFAPKYDTTPIYYYLYFPWISRLFQLFSLSNNHLTHWGRVTHICVGNLTIIVSDNGLSPGRRQAIFWTNVGVLLIRPLETNFSEIFIAIHSFSFKRMHLKMSSGKWRPSCFGLNVLTGIAYWFRDIVGVKVDRCPSTTMNAFTHRFSHQSLSTSAKIFLVSLRRTYSNSELKAHKICTQ